VKLAFAGTPDFAAWVLEHLEGLGRHVSLVITQPDRPSGRGRRATAPAAAVAAERLGVPWLQTADINEPSVVERLAEAGVSALVVASFGQIFRRSLLEAVLCLNIHASLLPAYRGAAPIERALAAGETRTGVTIMRMTESLDEGPWALQTSISVGLRDDAGSVKRFLALLGAIGIDQVVTGLSDGTVTWTNQEGLSSYASKLCPADCVFDATRGAKAAHDQVRSLSPGIGARAASGGLDFKLWRTWPYGQPGLNVLPGEGAAAAGDPGRVQAGEGRLFIGCSEGALEVLMLQPAGKSRMTAGAFLRGYRACLSDHLDLFPGESRRACDDQ